MPLYGPPVVRLQPPRRVRMIYAAFVAVVVVGGSPSAVVEGGPAVSIGSTVQSPPPNKTWSFPQCQLPYVAPPPAPVAAQAAPALELEVTMRDGVALHTIVYFPFYATKPPTKRPVGTILYRTPYNASSLAIVDNVSTEVLPYVLDPGLAVVIQDVRGCGPKLGCGRGTAHGCDSLPMISRFSPLSILIAAAHLLLPCLAHLWRGRTMHTVYTTSPTIRTWTATTP